MFEHPSEERDLMTIHIDYNHAKTPHTVGGATATLSVLMGVSIPASVLDVGCGTGTWLRAATELGVGDGLGIDGVVVPEDALHVPRSHIKVLDLSSPFDLGRRFDMVLCLEVAEHLPESAARGLISSIVLHSDSVLFSAACPGQPGQHHVNCRWPQYWQEQFNSLGFVCNDTARWKI
jgi:2-polyprenyl-3-methyl-5-hydroxy-6-metoxy-1,4-benzoquinol methylase